MSERAAIDFAAGRSRIFISGQSAGGAILPYGCAAPVQLIRDYSLKTPDLPPCRSQPCTNREEGRRRWTSQPSRSYRHGNDLEPRANDTFALESLTVTVEDGEASRSVTRLLGSIVRFVAPENSCLIRACGFYFAPVEDRLRPSFRSDLVKQRPELKT